MSYNPVKKITQEINNKIQPNDNIEERWTDIENGVVNGTRNVLSEKKVQNKKHGSQ